MLVNFYIEIDGPMTPSDHIKKAAVDKKASTKFGALHFYFVPSKLPIPAGARMVNIIRLCIRNQ